MKNLLIYDFLLALGGAENLSLEICNSNKELDFLVSFVNHENYPRDILNEKRLISLNKEVKHPVLQAFLISRAFSRLKVDIDKYNKVLFSGSYAPLAVINRTRTCHNYLYCHTPPRFVYDLHNNYLTQMSAWQRPIFKALVNWFRPQYENAVERMDLILANSANVKHRVQKYLNRDAQIIYPPVKTTEFTWMAKGQYFLSTARLEPYKRVDLIVKAFMAMPERKLIVASGGSQLAKLRKMASKSNNITFTGWTSATELKHLIGHAAATIYIPINEDFGMSPVESMAAGKPVIGVNDGGIKETVVNGVTGYLLSTHPTVTEIVELVCNIESTDLLAMKCDCIEVAKKFDAEVFTRAMKEVLL